MLKTQTRRIIMPFFLAMLLFVTACEGPVTQTSTTSPTPTPTSTPTPKAKPSKTTTTKTTTAVAKPLAGGSFNKFFPKPGGGFERVYTQEKTGFAEAKLKKDGKDVAMLSISDTANNAAAIKKFQSSDQKISGYPAVQQGSNSTAILVANRYQVKVQSRNSSFTKEDREAWIKKFNLGGLAKLR